MTRVPNCKGSYYRRKDGSCQIKYPLGYSESLHRYDSHIETFGTEAEAIAAIKEINAFVYHGGAISEIREHRKTVTGRDSASTMTFAEFAEKFVADRAAQGNVANRTLEDYRVHIKRISPYFGDVAVSSIDPMLVNELYTGLRSNDSRNGGAAPIGGTYLQHIHSTLSLILDRAVAYGMLKANPCNKVDKPKRDTKEREALTVAQCRNFLEWVLADELEAKTVGLLICLFTASRLSEMLALTWADVRDEGLYITKSMVKDTQQVKSTKTCDERVEPCPAILIEALGKWKAIQRKEFAEKGLKWGPDTPIVSNRKGTHTLKTTYEKWFRRSKAKYGLPADFTIHGFRHTVTTILQKDVGTDIATTMSITGHKTMQMLKRYSHTDHQARREALDALGRLLSPDDEEMRCRNCALWSASPSNGAIGACWARMDEGFVAVVSGASRCETNEFRAKNGG
ncbi:site-specific integrase [Collinsella tanakaei]|uniref:tyrosine-type recombinase/integrase n=1 Tax=Collinsella tanakaei TaxID=626935 RepID=UPI00195B2CA2|nr:integrase [Collinsella tanakaei]MBM6778752.1 site-specific integrase [Collinsella tanakaei]